METGDSVVWQAWFISLPVQTEVLRFDSSHHQWGDLPRDGAIAFRYDGLRLDGYDWYFRVDSPCGEIFGVDNETRNRLYPDEIVNRYPGADVFRGIWVAPKLIDIVHAELWR